MSLQVSLRLAAGNHGSHRKISKARDALVFSPDELFLHDKISLFL
jgi:hypothetical protein